MAEVRSRLGVILEQGWPLYRLQRLLPHVQHCPDSLANLKLSFKGKREKKKHSVFETMGIGRPVKSQVNRTI